MSFDTTEDARKITLSVMEKIAGFSPKIKGLKFIGCTPDTLTDDKNVNFTCRALNPATGDRFLVGVDHGPDHVVLSITKQGAMDKSVGGD